MTLTSPNSRAAAQDPRDRDGPAQPMLIVDGLKKYFPIHAGLLNRKVAEVKAVDDISFFVVKGETLGVVGESGCGKSTLARLLRHLILRDSGRLVLDGEAVGEASGVSLDGLRARSRWCFWTVRPRSIRGYRLDNRSPLVRRCKARAAATRRRRRALMEKVGLNP